MKSKIIFYHDVHENEKAGIEMISQILPEEHHHLLVSYHVAKENSAREIDLILVCPRGVFNIEMKNWYGELKGKLNYKDYSIEVLSDGDLLATKNPLKQVEEQRKRLKSQIMKNLDPDDEEDDEILENLNKNGGIRGVLFFTNQAFKLEVEDSGNIFILTPESDDSFLRKHSKKDVFTEEQVNRIVESFGQGIDVTDSKSVFQNGERISSYTIKELLHDGKNYKVYKAYNEDLDEYYFLKTVWINPGERKDAQETAQALGKRDMIAKNKLKSEPFVLFSAIPAFVHQAYIITVTQWIDHVTLEEKIYRNLSLAEKKTIIQDLTQALDGIHEAQVVHRDLNVQNIIFSEGQLKIINFDFAKLENKRTMINYLLGSEEKYRAPELINYDEYQPIDKRVDYYSVGLITYQLITGKVPPYEKLADKMFQKNIATDDGELDAILQDLLSDNLAAREEGFEKLKRWAS